MQNITTIGDWMLRLLLAALFVAQGVMKLGGSPAWVSRFRGWGYPDHFYIVIGVVELLAAIALIIPGLATFGAAVLIVVMAAATALLTSVLVALGAMPARAPSRAEQHRRKLKQRRVAA